MSIQRTIWAISIYGAIEQRGIVEVRLKDKRIQMLPEEARDFAHNILEAAEAAETDEFMVEFMKQDGGDARSAYKLLLLFRDFRDKKRREKSDRPQEKK